MLFELVGSINYIAIIIPWYSLYAHLTVLSSHRDLWIVVKDSVLDQRHLSWLSVMLYIICGFIISGLCCPTAFFTFLGVGMSVSAFFTPNSVHFFHTCLVLLSLSVTRKLYYTVFLFAWYTISVSWLELLVVIIVLILLTLIAVDLVDCTLFACRVVGHLVSEQTTWPMRRKS